MKRFFWEESRFTKRHSLVGFHCGLHVIRFSRNERFWVTDIMVFGPPSTLTKFRGASDFFLANSHNGYIEVALSLGIVGFIFCFLNIFFLVVLKRFNIG